MPRGISNDVSNFKEVLEKGVILVGGEVVDNNSIDVEDDTPVAVAIIVNVNGYGPHVGAISAVQGHIDEALQVADEILEEWEMDHNPDYYAELEKEHGDSAGEIFRETFDGIMWELPVEEFLEAIKGTAAEKFIDVVEYEEEGVAEESIVSEPNDARDILDGLGKYMQHEGHDAPREAARIARMIAGVRGDADRADKVLEEVNRLVDGHGIEAIRDENANDRYYGDVVALYVNMGDTYDTTLVYDTETQEFQVTSWGDWYEAYESEREQEDDEEEPEEEEDDVFSREEMQDGYVISDARGGGYAVSNLGRYDDMDEALTAIKQDMERENNYPNIYYVNDHGNIDLLDADGNVIRSQV